MNFWVVFSVDANFTNLGQSQDESALEICGGCGKEFKTTSLNRHIARSVKCKEHYGPEFEEMKKKARSNTNKSNYDNNSEAIRKRKAKSDSMNR